MKNKSVNDVNWDTKHLDRSLYGLYVNGFSILKDLNSAKTQDELPL